MKNVIGLLSALAGFFGMRMIHASPEAKISLGIAVGLVLTVSYALGWIVGRLTLNRVDVDGNNADIFAWTGIVLWIFPLFGLMNSAIVWQWANQTSTRALRYQVLSAIACIASVVMTVVGAASAIEQRTGEIFTFGFS